ncbi:MAG: carbonic anhydrase [Candidatus Micrarchaeota archaeon]
MKKTMTWRRNDMKKDKGNDNGIEKLRQGNKRYLMRANAKNFARRREETKDKQQPYAIIVTCSDSRVVPEYIFDANLGDIFVVRTAGNVIDKIALGSIEYAVEHLGASLIVVMGHEKCGAIKSAWEIFGSERGHTNNEHDSNITYILKKVKKAVNKAKKENRDIANAIIKNIEIQIETIVKKSALCANLVKQNKLKIIGMKYSIKSGLVEVFKYSNRTLKN